MCQQIIRATSSFSATKFDTDAAGMLANINWGHHLETQFKLKTNIKHFGRTQSYTDKDADALHFLWLLATAMMIHNDWWTSPSYFKCWVFWQLKRSMLDWVAFKLQSVNIYGHYYHIRCSPDCLFCTVPSIHHSILKT